MHSEQSPLTVTARHGNLFIGLAGIFGPETATALWAAIEGHYPGRGNIFIKTEQITEVLPAGRTTFRDRLPAWAAGNLYFIGTGGFELSPDGGRVIIRRPRKDRCRGCQNCRCKDAEPRPNSGLGQPQPAPFFHPTVRSF